MKTLEIKNRFTGALIISVEFETCADLSGCNLLGANLSGAKNIELAYLPMYCKWSYSIIGSDIKIGCKTKSVEQWDDFFSSTEECETSRTTPEFKQIRAIFEACKSYIKTINE